MNLNKQILPKTWTYALIEDIAEVGQGGTPSTLKKEYWDGDIPWVRSGEIKWNRITSSNSKITKLGLDNSSAKLLPKGTILLAMTGEGNTRGRSAIVDRECAANQSCAHIIVNSNLLNNEFLFYFFRHEYQNIRQIKKGSNQPGLNTSIIKGFFIPLPPIEEQNRIVSKLEKLLVNVKKGIDDFIRIQKLLKQYRHSILKSAFEGKLTANWRKENKLTNENNLSIIQNHKSSKLDNKPSIIHLNQLIIPDSWKSVRLAEITNKINPGFPYGKYNKNSGIPHLRPMNINITGEIDMSEVKYVGVDEYDRLLKGDILFNNTNSPALVGKTSVIKENTNWAYSNHMTRIRFNKEIVNPEWIAYSLHTLFLEGFFRMKCNNHVSQASINSTFLAQNVFIPLPPIEEQTIMVNIINRCLKIISESEKNIEKNIHNSNILRQSNLKNAFEGKLVKQNSTEEPPLVLLDKIKNEKRKITVRNSKKTNKKISLFQTKLL